MRMIYAVQKSMRADLKITSSQQSDPHDIWKPMDYIIGSTPLLLSDGQIVPRVLERISAFYKKKYARTAVGIRADGHWVFVVVDGNKKNTAGFTLPELAHYMQTLGCIQALNLCGGKSSTMVVQGAVVNKLVHRERSISTAILINHAS
jgi:exopolysaccharide biosynthesis protein